MIEAPAHNARSGAHLRAHSGRSGAGCELSHLCRGDVGSLTTKCPWRRRNGPGAGHRPQGGRCHARTYPPPDNRAQPVTLVVQLHTETVCRVDGPTCRATTPTTASSPCDRRRPLGGPAARPAPRRAQAGRRGRPAAHPAQGHRRRAVSPRRSGRGQADEAWRSSRTQASPVSRRTAFATRGDAPAAGEPVTSANLLVVADVLDHSPGIFMKAVTACNR